MTLQRERRLKQLEVQLAEVESFMSGSSGEHMMRLESELAEARLALAECESEKDDLEQELAECREDAHRAHPAFGSLPPTPIITAPSLPPPLRELVARPPLGENGQRGDAEALTNTPDAAPLADTGKENTARRQLALTESRC